MASSVVLEEETQAQGATYRVPLTLAVLRDSGWRVSDIAESARQAARILGQCSIRIGPIVVKEIEAPARYRVLFTPVSRELARRLALPKPTVYFVAGTRHRPPFDAEAVGRGNSRTRPEMADTVWIAAAARDLGVVIAHEIAHVLADSGEHSGEPLNLMGKETARDRTHLDSRQCAAIINTARANGLLEPLR